jgi:type III secretion protein L
VKAAQFTQFTETHQIVSAAQQYAASARSSADAQIVVARKKGYEKGMEEAHAEFATMIVEATARIESAFLGLEGRIVNTVMNALQQVLGEVDERHLMERMVRRVLANARAEKSLRLRVAEAQFDLVNKMLAAILQEFPQIEYIDVVKDPQGSPGTCVLESEYGVVDGSLDNQLAAVRAGLINAFVGKRREDGLAGTSAT